MKIKLGVIFGGRSVEHEVSVISAIQAMNNLDTNKYEIIPIYIDKDGIWYTGNMLKDIKVYSDRDLLKRYAKEVALYNKDNRFILATKGLFKKEINNIDIIFPIMHGTYGEDGCLQGYFETIGIPYCESNHYASVYGQDKVVMKDIFYKNKINICKYDYFYDYDYETNSEEIVKRLEKNIGYPMIIKPAHLGSSVGISIAHDEISLNESILDAIKFDNKILVEEVIQNLKEVNISVLGNYKNQKTSLIEEVYSSKDLLSYEDKYIGNSKTKGSKGMASASRLIPANIDKKLANDIAESAKAAFKCLGSSGLVRIDYLIDTKENKFYVNEINTIPGSLAFYLWNKIDKEYTELLDDIINIAIRDYKNKNSKITSFDTNILKDYDSSKGVKGVKK